MSGESFSAARPIDLIPPMITSHVSTAIATPETSVGTPNTRVEHERDRVGLREGRRRQRRDAGDECEEPREERATAGHRAGSTSGPTAPSSPRTSRNVRPSTASRELDRRRHEPVDPDPEERARAARHDAGRDAGDVAGADRGAERRHERLKRRQHAVAPTPPPTNATRQRLAEAPHLHEPGAQRQEEPDPSSTSTTHGMKRPSAAD